MLRAGGLVAFPTETVYGLGADAASERAVRRLFAVKGRPASHPVIVHLASVDRLDEWAAAVPEAARRLAAAFWPGPLTLLVPKAAQVLDLVTGGRPAIGLRVPDQPLALELLAAFGGGLAAPSANRFGRVSPTTAAHVRADLGDDVDLVLDGGPCTVGVESTIVDLTVETPTVLRPGRVSAAELEAVLGGRVAAGAGPARAPGMLPSHYAPTCRIELAEDRRLAERRVGELREEGVVSDVLAPEVDADTYAQHLYEWLRAADDKGIDVVVVVPPPPVGVGLAVRDRLVKAAAPRAGEERS